MGVRGGAAAEVKSMGLCFKFMIALMAVCIAAGQSKPGAPDLAGFWELHFDSMNVPPAPLTPEIAAEDKSVQYKLDMTAMRWCHFFGMPYMMGASPIDILPNRDGNEIVIAAPVRTPARHIYTDGRSHVSPDIFD